MLPGMFGYLGTATLTFTLFRFLFDLSRGQVETPQSFPMARNAIVTNITKDEPGNWHDQIRHMEDPIQDELKWEKWGNHILGFASGVPRKQSRFLLHPFSSMVSSIFRICLHPLSLEKVEDHPMDLKWFIRLVFPKSWDMPFRTCRTPVWLKTAFAVLVQEGGVLVHGWCAEKENRGKGGSGKGKIGAGVGSCRSMDPVGISSGPSRAPIFAFLGTAFGQSGSSRDPVGHQCREAAKFIKNCIFAVFLRVFGWFWLLPDRSKRGAKNSKIGARLDPDWIPTGQKRCPKMQKLAPDWVPNGSRLGFFKKTPISLNLSTYFWNFSTLPCTTPPPFPPPDPPPPVLSQTWATQFRTGFS